MESKKINQLATEMSPAATDLTIIGDPITGVSKKITLEQISSLFAGSISFYTNYASFPATGVIDTIYCAKDTKKLYLWSGSVYVEIFPNQALLDTYQLRSEKGNANGYASLDSGGKVPVSQLPSSIMEYKGMWSAATNTPTLANGTGDTGDVYICNAAGSVNFGAGSITFAVGDYVIYSGSIWQRSSGAVGTVTSVGLSSSTSGITIGSSPVTTSGTISLAIATASGTQQGLLSSTDWTIFNNKQNAITLTTTGTSGAATLVGSTLNIPQYTDAYTGTVTSVAMTVPTGLSVSGSPITTSGTLAVSLASGYSIPTTANQTNWTTAYNDSIVSAAVTGTTTKTLTLTQQDGGTVIASWSDYDTAPVTSVFGRTGAVTAQSGDYTTTLVTEGTNLYFTNARSIASTLTGYVSGAGTITSADSILSAIQKLNGNIGTLVTGVSSVFGRTGAVVAASGDYTTTQVTEGTNLYYTDARARGALSFTAGSGAYNSTTGVITIPTNTNQLTNGASFITLTSLSAGTGISYNNTTGVISSTITQYTDAMARAAISLTTTGTSGAATYNSTTGVLNIPQYTDAYTGTVTSVAMTVPTGLSVSGSPITTSGTLAVTLTAGYSIPTTASQTNWDTAYTNRITSATSPLSITSNVISINQATTSTNGYLSSTDWNTFNNKQSALTNPVTGSGTTNYLPKFTGTSTIGNSAITDDGTTVTLVSRALSGTSATFSGNVGLGSLNSSWQSTAYALQAGSTVALSAYGLSKNLYFDGSDYRALTTGYGSLLQSTSGGFTFYSTTASVTAGAIATLTSSLLTIASTGAATFTFDNNSSGVVYKRNISGTIYELGSVKNSGSDIYYQGTGNVFINADSNSDSTGPDRNVIFGNRGVEYARITSDGNALIGTTTDAGYKLNVNGSLNIGQDQFLRGGGYKMAYRSSTINFQYSGTTGWQINNDADNVALLTIANSGAATFSSSVTASGLLSVSVADNTNAFNIYGNNSFNSAYRYLIASTGANAPDYQAQDRGAVLNIGTRGGSPYKSLATEGGAYFALSGGNVLIGTTTDNGNKLQVNGITQTLGLSLSGTSVSSSTTISSSYYMWVFNGGSGQTLTLYSPSGHNNTHFIKNSSANSLTLSGTYIETLTSTTTVTSYTIPAYKTVQLISNGGSVWIIMNAS